MKESKGNFIGGLCRSSVYVEEENFWPVVYSVSEAAWLTFRETERGTKREKEQERGVYIYKQGAARVHPRARQWIEADSRNWILLERREMIIPGDLAPFSRSSSPF